MSNEKSETVLLFKSAMEARGKTAVPAAARIRQGKIMLAVGTTIAILGIIVYCATIFLGDINSQPVRFSAEGLIIIGAGVAVWICGAVRYLNAAIDANDPEDLI